MIADLYLKEYQKAGCVTRKFIKAINLFIPPAYELGPISFTIDKCKENNRTVFEFNDYFLINIDGMIFYCLQSDI